MRTYQERLRVGSIRLLLTVVATACFPSAGFAQVATTLAKGETGKIVFRSVTPPGMLSEMAQKKRNLPPVEVWGELDLPRNASGKVPAMVLLTTSGGVNQVHMNMWHEKFLDMGIAAFTIDSFTGRGISSGISSHSLAQMVDAYEALKLLATHPGIDAERVSVIGFSLGARAAIEAAIEEFREMYDAGALRFAAYFALYPACNIRFIDAKVRPEPIVVFLPEKEDWTPLAHCQAYIESHTRSGGNIRGVLLPGAYHGFDQLDRNVFGKYANLGTCNVESSFKSLERRRADTGELLTAGNFLSYLRTCRGYRASLIGDRAVLATVETEIKKVLSAVFSITIK